LCRGWMKTQRRQWTSKQRKRLSQGQVSRVIEAVDELCNGRMSKTVRTKRNYFHENTERMDYSQIQLEHLPFEAEQWKVRYVGWSTFASKGLASFGNEDSANALLMLRSYYKTVKTQDIARLAFTPLVREAA